MPVPVKPAVAIPIPAATQNKTTRIKFVVMMASCSGHAAATLNGEGSSHRIQKKGKLGLAGFDEALRCR
jgi:hypothetical protein